MEFRTLKDGRVIPIAKPNTVSLQSNLNVPQKPASYKGYGTRESFTIPNYLCRTCGRHVFYYEHPNGAKVLFDSLGPPWPKHPCYLSFAASKASNAISKAKQKTNNWLPAFLERAIALKSGAIRVQIVLDEHQLRFELSSQHVRSLAVNQISIRDALFQVNSLSLNSHVQEVSIHTGKCPITLLAHKVVVKTTVTPAPATNQASVLKQSNNKFKDVDTVNKVTNPAQEMTRQSLILTGISLTIKSDSYFFITGTCHDKPMLLGASLELNENQGVFNVLKKNPASVELVPVKKAEGLFHIIHKNSKLGRLEQVPELIKTAQETLPITANEKPPRDSVLSNSVLMELKGQMTKQTNAKKRARVFTVHKPYT